LVDHAGILGFSGFRLSSVCHEMRDFSQRCDRGHHAGLPARIVTSATSNDQL
jgi:hypothetical protein